MASGAATDDRPSLSFRVGDAQFRVPAAIVREVARLPRITRVPQAPASLLGLGNFRGSVFPIISFAALTDRVPGDERRVILFDTANPVALAVDAVARLAGDDATPIDIEALTARDFNGGRARRARAVSRAERQAAEGADRVPLLLFAVGGQDYALPIAAVDEVLRRSSDVAPVPQADEAVVGSIAVRDALVPLLSLHALLAFPGPGGGRHDQIVVARIGAHRVGLTVDAIHAIVHVAASAIDPLPAVLARGGAEARIQAICRLDEGRRLVSVLAAEHLLREDLTARLMQGGAATAAPRAAGATAAGEQFLLFRIGDEEFGLPIASVVEVAVPPASLTRLPQAPDFVQGVLNRHGRVVPVIDQPRRFGRAAAGGGRRRVIVVETGHLQAGFVVDSVSEVLRVPAAALRPAPELGGAETPLFDRVANLVEAGRMILIVSPQALLDDAERALLAGLRGKTASIP